MDIIAKLEERWKTWFPRAPWTPVEGTYLAWLRVEGLPACPDGDDEALANRLETQAGVRVSPGSWFHTGGQGYIRLNLACPGSLWESALDRVFPFLDNKVKS